MTKRIQIVARIDPALRRAVARAMKRNRTTLNALVDTALHAYLGPSTEHTSPKAEAKEPR